MNTSDEASRRADSVGLADQIYHGAQQRMIAWETTILCGWWQL